MIIGVKYCGGCNPTYDRKKVLNLLQEEYNHQFEFAIEGKVYDIVIVLCGCNRCCAQHSRFIFKYEKFLVKSMEDYYTVKSALDKYSNN